MPETTWWRRPYTWALASAIGVIVSNLGGLAIGDDGVGYQATADNLVRGKGLGYFLEPQLTIWPPGWPLLMAAIARLTPLDTEQAAIALNVLTAIAIVVLVHRLLVRLVRNPDLVLLGTAVSAVGASTMVFGHLLMTDLAFVAVTLATFLALMNYRRSDEPGWLAVAVVLVWAGFMIRYVGVVNIATVGLWFLTDRRRGVAARVGFAAAFGLVAGVVPGVWILRNLSTDHTVLGVRWSSNRGLIPNTFDLLATIGNFLTPGIAIGMRMVWAAVALAGIAVMVTMLWRVVGVERRIRSGTDVVDMLASEAGLLVIHVVGFAVYMLYARTTTGLNQLDFRLLNPIYLPLVIVALVILGRVERLGRRQHQPRWATAARSTAIAWAAVNVVLGVGMVAYFSTGPDMFEGNYESDAFEAVRASDALDAIPDGCRTSSNLPNALYGSGVNPQWSPRETGLESPDPVDDLDRLDEALADGRHSYCLVWVDLAPVYGHLATLEELDERYDLDPLASDGDVAVFEIRGR